MRRSLALCCALAAAALVAVAGDSGGTGCPALFRGKDCTEPVLGLPSCLPGRDPYRFKFFSLTRRKFPQFLKTRWGRTMWMANRTVVRASLSPAPFSKLRPLSEVNRPPLADIPLPVPPFPLCPRFHASGPKHLALNAGDKLLGRAGATREALRGGVELCFAAWQGVRALAPLRK